MKAIIGLGNPSEEYKGTRHNVGHIVVDYLKDNFKDNNFVFIKSKEFMNSSGKFVSDFIRKNKVNINNLYIIHDDLDIKLGEYKIQKGKGPKDHNGILSIENELSEKGFWRIRIGVENRDNNIPGEKYVLQKFTDDELSVINSIVRKIKDELYEDR